MRIIVFFFCPALLVLFIAQPAKAQQLDVEAFYSRLASIDPVGEKNMRALVGVTINYLLVKNKQRYDEKELTASERYASAEREAILLLIHYTDLSAKAFELSLKNSRPDRREFYFDSLLSISNMQRIPEIDSTLQAGDEARKHQGNQDH